MIQEKLRNFRKKKGYSQDQMAKFISTDTSNYSRKERGEVKIHEDEWQKLAEALDVPIESIRESENKYSFQYDNSTFHDHLGSNINYYNIPNSLIENLQDYISILKSEIISLKEENAKFKKTKLYE